MKLWTCKKLLKFIRTNRFRKTIAPNERGFSLLEVLVALAIFMVGLMGLVALQVASAASAQTAGELTIANNLASAALEYAQVMNYTNLPAVGATSTNFAGQITPSATGFTKFGATTTSPYFTVLWDVLFVAANNAYKDIRVTVSWQMSARDQARQVTLQTRAVP